MNKSSLKILIKYTFQHLITTKNSELLSRDAMIIPLPWKFQPPEKNQLFVPIESSVTSDTCFSYCCGCFVQDSHIIVGKSSFQLTSRWAASGKYFCRGQELKFWDVIEKWKRVNGLILDWFFTWKILVWKIGNVLSRQ